MQIRKEKETIIFDYERKRLEVGDRTKAREFRAALSSAEKPGTDPETELSLLLASLARTPEELARLLAIANLEKELGTGAH